MIKLKKPKGFEVSKKTVIVNIDGSDYECANLLKSGITIQSKILIAYNDVWHEIDILNLGADDSNLNDFKNHCGLHSYTLADLGIKTEAKKKVLEYGLSHDDYMKIESKFPDYSYVKIGKLHKYLSESQAHVHYSYLQDHVKMCNDRGITIDTLIQELSKIKSNIINNQNPITKMENTAEKRIAELQSFGAVEVDGNYQVVGMEITGEMITNLPEAGWEQIMAGVQMLAPKTTEVDLLVNGPDAPGLPESETPMVFETDSAEILEVSKARTKARSTTLISLGFEFKNSVYIGHGFTVTLKSIAEDSEDDFRALLIRIEESDSYKTYRLKPCPETTSESESLPATPIAESTGTKPLAL